MSANISVVVPVYKGENYLEECIDSILNQSFQNIELILVDDGSPDNSGAICDDYAARDSRVKVIHKNNEGINKRGCVELWKPAVSGLPFVTMMIPCLWMHWKVYMS